MMIRRAVLGAEQAELAIDDILGVEQNETKIISKAFERGDVLRMHYPVRAVGSRSNSVPPLREFGFRPSRVGRMALTARARSDVSAGGACIRDFYHYHVGVSRHTLLRGRSSGARRAALHGGESSTPNVEWVRIERWNGRAHAVGYGPPRVFRLIFNQGVTGLTQP